MNPSRIRYITFRGTGSGKTSENTHGFSFLKLTLYFPPTHRVSDKTLKTSYEIYVDASPA